jgi:vancomycin resistance protein YoaR
LPELVIKKEGTVPEFGGGLCQVSSTAFRAAMNGGLPITQRRNHAYAVQYYAPQGTDATIYPGVVDLKFINDTPGDILIWAFEKIKIL